MRKFIFLMVVLLFAIQGLFAQETYFQKGHSGNINEVRWSPDDSKILSHSWADSSLKLWDVKTGRQIWIAKTSFVSRNKKLGTLITYDWSPDQKIIASGSYNGTIQIWNAETGKPIRIIDAHFDDVTHVKFTPDGKWLISSSNSFEVPSEIKIWNLENGSLVKKLEGNPCTTIASTFSEDGKIFKTGNLEGEVLKWDLESGKLLNPQDSKCRIVRITDGKVGYSGDLKLKAQKEGTNVVLYETENNQKVKEFPSDESSRISILFSRNNRFLSFTGYGKIKVFDLNTNERFEVDEINSGFTVDISNDGKYFAQGGGYGDASILVSEIKTNKSFYIDGHPSTIGGISYTPDGKVLAVGGSDKIIYLFDLAQKKLLKKLVSHTEPLKQIAFSPDGKVLVSNDDEGVLKIWDWENGKILQELKSDNGINEPDKIEFSTDGKYFLIIVNGSLGIFNVKDWSLLRTIKTKEGYESKSGNMTIGYSSVPISSAAFAENGAKIITTHDDESLRIWETNTGKEIKKINVGETAPLLLVINKNQVIVPVGKWDEQKLKLFDIESGKELRTYYEEYESKFEAISLNPDGKSFITANSAGDVVLWDLTKNKAVREFDIGYSGDDSIAFSPDGKTFAVGGRNQNLFMFDAETGEKLWQLIPSYQESEIEKKLNAEAKALRDGIDKKLAERKTQAEIYVKENKGKITAKFSHYGDAESFWDQKIAESGQPNKSKLKKSKDKATVAWFTLTNNADLPIAIDTNSMYLNPKCKGLCEGAEISSRYVMELENEETRVNGYDAYSNTILPPNTTIYFSISLEHIADSKAIYLGYTFQKDNPDNDNSNDYGTKQKSYVNFADLP